MDSLTQILLGASVAELTIGRAVGRKATLCGAMLGTLPDLDVLINFGGPVENFIYHRGFSHSLIVLGAASPIIGWALHRFSGLASMQRWTLMVWLVFTTHVLLDAMTVYGTQLFWPVSDYPVIGSAVFIIDPAYTIWLALGVGGLLLSMRAGESPDKAHRFNSIMLALSCAYLAWAWTAKAGITEAAARSLERQGIAYTRLLSTPAPFNTLLWRFVAMHPDGSYSEGYRSVFDGRADVKFLRYESDTASLEKLRDSWHAQKLKWFSHGFYKVQRASPSVIVSDLRMGVEGQYVFRFKVGEIAASGKVSEANVRVPAVRDMSRLPLVWWRIWDESISLAP